MIAHDALGRVRPTLRASIAGLLLGFACACPGALAQEATEEEPVKQIRLTETQIKNFISAQPDLPIIAKKLQEAGDEPDPALEEELEAIAKKHGFSDFSELDDVAANISLVMAGLDPDTSEYTDPVAALKKELEEVKADPSIPDADKSQLTTELTEAIATTAPLRFPENVPLVEAHRKEIEKGLQ